MSVTYSFLDVVASFSGPTAKPHTMVGGKTKKRHGGRKYKHSKSCKH